VFLQVLFSESYYPSYAKLPFWVFGESYGGHYGPALSSIILEQNQAILNGSAPSGAIYINFKGTLCFAIIAAGFAMKLTNN